MFICIYIYIYKKDFTCNHFVSCAYLPSREGKLSGKKPERVGDRLDLDITRRNFLLALLLTLLPIVHSLSEDLFFLRIFFSINVTWERSCV